MSPSKSRKPLPAPDDSGTSVDPDAVLRNRISLGRNPLAPDSPSSVQSIPREHTSVGVYGQERAAQSAQRSASAGRSPRRREDPAGMKRQSIYISERSARSLETAVDQITEALGGDIAKHVVLSALIEAAASAAGDVAAQLAQQRAALLAQQLQRLQDRA